MKIYELCLRLSSHVTCFETFEWCPLTYFFLKNDLPNSREARWIILLQWRGFLRLAIVRCRWLEVFLAALEGLNMLLLLNILIDTVGVSGITQYFRDNLKTRLLLFYGFWIFMMNSLSTVHHNTGTKYYLMRNYIDNYEK